MWKIENQRGILLIDEPDSHIHPDLQQKFAKFLVDLNQRFDCPIIISTHSTTMLSALGHYGKDTTSVVYLDTDEEQRAIRFDKLLKELSTCLGGHALMGPLFGFSLLLVEGDDDYRIWSEIPRHNSVKISVILCNGEEIFQYQKKLEKLFSSILDYSDKPSGYVILDGDKSKKNENTDYIKFLKLNCHESENLYLTNEVLQSLGFDWNTACEKIINESHFYGEKKDELASVRTWDRQKVDCKNVINELAKILDPKNLSWAHRVGKELGKHKPEGQISLFLGDEIVNTIWKNNIIILK